MGVRRMVMVLGEAGLLCCLVVLCPRPVGSDLGGGPVAEPQWLWRGLRFRSWWKFVPKRLGEGGG